MIERSTKPNLRPSAAGSGQGRLSTHPRRDGRLVADAASTDSERGRRAASGSRQDAAGSQAGVASHRLWVPGQRLMTFRADGAFKQPAALLRLPLKIFARPRNPATSGWRRLGESAGSEVL